MKPVVKAENFTKYGFKKCKGMYGKNGCYYLCVNRGRKMLFVSDEYFSVSNWDKNDPRIHSKPNCKYSDKRTYLDIVFELIHDGMILSEYFSTSEYNVKLTETEMEMIENSMLLLKEVDLSNFSDEEIEAIDTALKKIDDIKGRK